MDIKGGGGRRQWVLRILRHKNGQYEQILVLEKGEFPKIVRWRAAALLLKVDEYELPLCQVDGVILKEIKRYNQFVELQYEVK